MSTYKNRKTINFLDCKQNEAINLINIAKENRSV